MNSLTLWLLVGAQMVMGLFDMLYHHEMTERLAWRPSQEHELRLHAVRNWLYSVLFFVLGWAEVHGWLAFVIIAVVMAEVVITLLDFVEEDVSRKLPATERVTHTLLALNYGAILALLIPVLTEWWQLPTGGILVSHGIWSIGASIASFGTLIFGFRDFAAAGRSKRLRKEPGAQLAGALSGRQTILVTGATGFIGGRLTEALVAGGHDVIVLTRDPAKSVLFAPPYRIVTDLDQLPASTRINAIVNLAGEPIANGPWTAAKRAKIISSRVNVTDAIMHLIERSERRPSVLINGSAIGWYGLRGDEKLTEADDGMPCFSREICERWETAALRAQACGVRTVLLRIGLVLGTEGGILSGLLTPFEFGMGGPIGSGRQWMSWIERDDLVSLICYAIASPKVSGPLNATAPEPVRNDKFVAELGRVLHRPAIMRIPAFFLRKALGQFADELLLGGQRVVPEKALAAGFVFRHATLDRAFTAIIGNKAKMSPNVGLAIRPTMQS